LLSLAIQHLEQGPGQIRRQQSRLDGAISGDPGQGSIGIDSGRRLLPDHVQMSGHGESIPAGHRPGQCLVAESKRVVEAGTEQRPKDSLRLLDARPFKQLSALHDKGDEEIRTEGQSRVIQGSAVFWHPHRLTAHLDDQGLGSGLERLRRGHAEGTVGQARQIHARAGEGHDGVNGQRQRSLGNDRLQSSDPMTTAQMHPELPWRDHAGARQALHQAGERIVGDGKENEIGTDRHLGQRDDGGGRQQGLGSQARQVRDRRSRHNRVPGPLQSSSDHRSRPTCADHADAQSWRCRHLTERRGSLASVFVAAAKTWRESWEDSAFGAVGFYRVASPYDHFTTTAQQGRLTSQITPYLHRLLRTSSTATVVDAGAGDAELLVALLAQLPRGRRRDVRFIAIDLRPRPSRLPDEIEWWQEDVRLSCRRLPAGPGLLIAHELLDDIPCEIIELDEEGELHTLTHEAGTAALGPAWLPHQHGSDRAWIKRWWPAEHPLMRIEIGRDRDALWHQLTSWLTLGYAMAFDYGHVRSERERRLWDGGTFTGYRGGRTVAPQFDSSMNLTAHVAMDSVAAAASGHPHTELTRADPGGDFWRLVQTYGGLCAAG